jgi:hypothetical protein
VAHIVIITDTYDDFHNREYLLEMLFPYWTNLGHHVSVVTGEQEWPDADVAFMHVDLSVIPDSYVQAAKRYPVVFNGKALDIRKRKFSTMILRRTDTWPGRVIVKTNLNNKGHGEARRYRIMRERNLPIDVPPEGISVLNAYPMFDSMQQVPAQVWETPGVVVERFVPERDESGFWMRTWVFLGAAERCNRFLSKKAIVKGSNVIAKEPCTVPDEIRWARTRLGFDYGKFDFVIHQGKPILLDANRTPALLVSMIIPAISSAREQANRLLCMSQMRQWTTTFSVIAVEQKGYLPFRNNGQLDTSDYGNASSFLTDIYTLGYIPSAPLGTRVELGSCPSRGNRKRPADSTSYFFQTGHELGKAPWNAYYMLKLESLDNDCIMVFDHSYYDGTNTGNSKYDQYFASNHRGTGTLPDGMNVTYADGSGKWNPFNTLAPWPYGPYSYYYPANKAWLLGAGDADAINEYWFWGVTGANIPWSVPNGWICSAFKRGYGDTTTTTFTPIFPTSVHIYR